MVFHRNQAQFERAKWRTLLLMPFWIFQVAMLLSLMGIFSFRLAETVEHFEENDKKGKVPTVEFVWECTNIAFSLVCLILTVMEVSRLFTETLTPFFMVASHVVKMTCAFAILALDIVVYIDRSDGNWSIVGLAIDCGLLASMLSLGIYSIIKFRRLLKYDDYHHPVNVKAFGFGNGYSEIEMGGVGNDSFLRASPYNEVPTEYPPQSGTRNRAQSAASSLRRISGTSLRRISGSSIPGKTGTSPPVERPNPLAEEGRRESYNHERSTQFDEYMSRGSSALNKEDIDQAIGAELWGNGTRSNSLVGTGAVAAQAVQSNGHSLKRASSHKAEHVGIPVSPENIAPSAFPPTITIGSPHIAPIAEVHEEDDEEEEAIAAALGRGRRHVPNDEDRALLMGQEEPHQHAVVHDDDDDDDNDNRVRPEIPGPEPDHTHKGNVA